MPRTHEVIENCKREFCDIAKFPFVIGCIACTHVKIQSPGGNDAKLFKNEKGYSSLNVQTVSDARLKIRDVAYLPGSTHDSVIFTDSTLCRQFEMGVYGESCLLGDSAYPLKNYLLTPYVHTSTTQQEQYNMSHIKTRAMTVDRLYGVLKRRFPVLALGLRVNLQTAVEVILACCILHNICIDNGEDVPHDEIDTHSLDTHIENSQIEHIYNNPDGGDEERRTIITCNFFPCNPEYNNVYLQL